MFQIFLIHTSRARNDSGLMKTFLSDNLSSLMLDFAGYFLLVACCLHIGRSLFVARYF